VVLALGTGVALPAIPVLAKSFDVGFGLASWVITAFLIGSMVGSVPTGWLIDRFGRRPIMIAGPLLTSAMALMVLVAGSFPELLLYRFLDGWAAQMWLLGRLAGISQNAGAGERGRQVSWMYGMDNVGRLAGPLVGGFIAAAWGPRSPFAAYAALALLALIPTFFLVESAPPRATAKAAAEENRGMTVAQIILPRLPFFGVALLSAIARGPIFAGMLFLYAAFAYGLDAPAIGTLATAASVISLPIGFLAGWIMDRFGRKYTMVPGFCSVTAMMFLLALTAFGQVSLIWFLAVFLVAVAAQSLTGGSSQTSGADVAPPEARGRFLGLWGLTGQLGTTLSPVVFALIADHLGYGFAFVFLAVAAGGTALLILTSIPETRKARPA
jgi:MFS family permease